MTKHLFSCLDLGWLFPKHHLLNIWTKYRQILQIQGTLYIFSVYVLLFNYKLYALMEFENICVQNYSSFSYLYNGMFVYQNKMNVLKKNSWKMSFQNCFILIFRPFRFILRYVHVHSFFNNCKSKVLIQERFILI